jgi:protein-tyrosine phosphatase
VAAALFTARVAGPDGLVPQGWEVGSAGTMATLGPSPTEVVAAASAVGLDVSGHRSRQVTPELLDDADLVVAMAREHVRSVAVMLPGVFNRTFTLRELIRELDGAPAATGLVGLGQDRRPTDVLSAPSSDDVTDPYGGPRPGYVRMVDELDALVSALVAALADPAGAAG